MWKPIDTQFDAPRLPMSIVAASGGEYQFLRALLEELNCVVLTHLIGTPSDFLKVIAEGRDAPRYVIVSGHGTPDGLYFGEYGPSDIDTSMLRNRCMPPEVIREHVFLPGRTVISTCCLGGEEAMARAFLSGRLSGYIGCRGYPDAVAMSAFMTNLLFGITVRKLSDRDAWHRAVAATDHEDVYAVSYYHGDGSEERF